MPFSNEPPRPASRVLELLVDAGVVGLAMLGLLSSEPGGLGIGCLAIALAGLSVQVRARLQTCSERCSPTYGGTPSIVADVEDAIGRGRNCLVLTRRVAHLEVLAWLT